jgi:hypothetical protein
MLIRMIVKDAARGYDEKYASPDDVSNMSEDQQAEEAWRIAEEVIQNFNDTLRPHELARTLQSATILDLTTQPECHRWEKTSVVIQAADHIGMHETHYCPLCNNTGKQYQIQGPIIVDGSQDDDEGDDEGDEMSETELRLMAKVAQLEIDNKLLTDFVDSVNTKLS